MRKYMTPPDNQSLNEAEDTTLPVPEVISQEARDDTLAVPGFLSRIASSDAQVSHQETTSTSTISSPPAGLQGSLMPEAAEEATRKRNAKTIQIAGKVVLLKDLTFADGDGKRIHWREMANKKGITHAAAYGRITSQNWDHESDLIKALSMPTRGKGQPQEREDGNSGAIHTETPEPQPRQSEVQTAVISTNVTDDLATQLSKIDKAVQAARIVNGLDLDPDIREQLFVTALKAAMATMQKVLDAIEK
jgi:hypothetical protein